MNDRDLTYHRMDGERLYGRGEFLDTLMDQFGNGCTLFGLHGVSGIGKSEVADRFAFFASRDEAYAVVSVDLSDRPTQILVIADVYEALKSIPKTYSQQTAGMLTDLVEKAPIAVRSLLAAAFRDVIKKIGAEHTVGAIAKLASGDGPETGAEILLSKAAEDNQRFFIREYMNGIANLGYPIIIVIDNYEDAEPSAQDFVRWLLKAKPENCVLIVSTNVEKLASSNWASQIAPMIPMLGGYVHVTDAPSREAIGEWFEDVVKRPPSEGDISQAIDFTNQGRPVMLRQYLSTIAAGKPLPRIQDLSGLHSARRATFDRDARRVAELIAMAGPDAKIPRAWLETAAHHYGVGHVGSAIDALKAAFEIVESDNKLSLYHASYSDSWYHALAKPDLLQAQIAWYEVYRESLEGVVPWMRSRLLPALAPEIAARESGANITQVADGLIASGGTYAALAIVDASWQMDGAMNPASTDVIDHALIAAQARLDIGQYREAQASLQLVTRREDRDPIQTIRADLIAIKLALRQNAYSTVWHLSEKLQKEAADDPKVQLSRELVVNTAYRDLYQKSEISDSVDRLRSILGSVSAADRGRAGRSLARSLAKLGQASDAIATAEAALASANEEKDLREIGNAHLAMAESLRYAGRLDDATAEYREAESIARGTGNRDSEIWSILGRACTHLQNGALDAADAAASSARRLVSEPGFEHPLETAHLGLIEVILGSLRQQSVDTAAAVRPYDNLGISWPSAFISAFNYSRTIGEAIPI